MEISTTIVKIKDTDIYIYIHTYTYVSADGYESEVWVGRNKITLIYGRNSSQCPETVGGREEVQPRQHLCQRSPVHKINW